MDARSKAHRLSLALLRGMRASLGALSRAARALAIRLGRLPQSEAWRRARRHAAPVLRVTLLGGGLAALLIGLQAACLVRIEPGEIGVRQREWGAERGVEAVDHVGPKLLVSWPGRDRWHRIDGRTRIVTFATAQDGGALPPLEVRTREGNSARISASVPYRVVQGGAHQIVAAGAKQVYERQVGTSIEKVLVQELARLSSDELHDPERRRTVSDEALAILGAHLAPYHLEVGAVLIRDVEFPPTYEQTRQEQQLAGQTARTQEMLDRLAERQLDNEFVAHGIARDKKDLLEGLKRAWDDAEREAKRALERQRLENQALEQELEAQLARRAAELDALFAQARYEEEVVALQQLARRRQDLEEDLARAEERLEAELAAASAAEQRAGEAELAALEHEQHRAGQALSAEAEELAAELASAREESISAARASLAALRRAAERSARELRDAAELRHDALLAEGEQALEAAAVERERLRGEVLATAGGRLWVAREAASRLRFGRVVLDPGDARVPSPLELDALTALLLGSPAPPSGAPRGGR